LRRTLANERRRHLRTAMRSIRREIALDTAAAKQQPDRIDRESESASMQMQTREEDEALQGALRQLPERYRQVLQLHSQEGMTFAQVGGRLRCSAEAARKLWRRAAEQLTRLLRDARIS
jgi:RNA polymerase sigma factor (sigma-70 family)